MQIATRNIITEENEHQERSSDSDNWSRSRKKGSTSNYKDDQQDDYHTPDKNEGDYMTKFEAGSTPTLNMLEEA